MNTTPALTDFAQTHKKLMTHARADALSCIHRAQVQVHSVLLPSGVSETVLRMVTADITETLMVKALLLLSAAPQYGELETVAAREGFLATYLALSLLTWLAEKAEPVERSRIVSSSAKILACQ